MTQIKDSQSLAELTEMYNSLAPKDKQVKKFRDKPTAQRRLTDLMAGAPSKAQPEPTDADKAKTLAKVLAKSGDVPAITGTVENKAKGNKYDLDLTFNSKINLKDAVSQVQHQTRGITLVGKRSKFAGKRIKIISEKNPRRAGTAGWHNWNIYDNLMTYEQFIIAKGGANHLRWDVEHGFIELI